MSVFDAIRTVVRGVWDLRHDGGASTGRFSAGFGQAVVAPGGVVSLGGPHGALQLGVGGPLQAGDRAFPLGKSASYVRRWRKLGVVNGLSRPWKAIIIACRQSLSLDIQVALVGLTIFFSLAPLMLN